MSFFDMFRQDTCANHIHTEGRYYCFSCKRHFCSDCMVDGKGYSHCRFSGCTTEARVAILPRLISCPHCSEELKLSRTERMWREFSCPCCDARCTTIDAASNKFKIMQIEDLPGNWGKGEYGLIGKATRAMTGTERRRLEGYESNWFRGDPSMNWYRERLAIDLDRGTVEALQVRAKRIWGLRTCGPDCCQRTYAIEIDADTYLTLNTYWMLSLELFADEMEEELPMTDQLEVVLSPITRLLLDVRKSGREIQLESENFCSTTDGNPTGEVGSLFGWYCQLLSREELPQIFKSAISSGENV